MAAFTLFSTTIQFNLEKSVGSLILAQALDSTALQKNTRSTEWVKLRFFQSTVKPIACTIIPRPTDLSRFNSSPNLQVMQEITVTCRFCSKQHHFDRNFVDRVLLDQPIVRQC